MFPSYHKEKNKQQQQREIFYKMLSGKSGTTFFEQIADIIVIEI